MTTFPVLAAPVEDLKADEILEAILHALYPGPQHQNLILLGRPYPVSLDFKVNCQKNTGSLQAEIIINNPEFSADSTVARFLNDKEIDSIVDRISSLEDNTCKVNLKEKIIISILDPFNKNKDRHTTLDNFITEPEDIRKALEKLDLAIAQYIIENKTPIELNQKSINALVQQNKADWINKLNGKWGVLYYKKNVLEYFKDNTEIQTTIEAATNILGGFINDYIEKALSNIDWVQRCQRLDLKTLTPDKLPTFGRNNLTLNETIIEITPIKVLKITTENPALLLDVLNSRPCEAPTIPRHSRPNYSAATHPTM